MIKKIILFISMVGIFILYTNVLATPSLKVHVEGVSGEVLQNVDSRLDLPRLDEINSFEAIREFYVAAPTEIKKALEPFGYFNAQVKSSLLQDQSVWQATFYVTPGTPLRVGSLDLQIRGEGVTDPAFQQLLVHFPLATHHIFSVVHYKEATQQLQELARSRGYFAARIEQKQIIVDLKNHTVRIILHFNTGKRYRFGAIVFNTNPFAKKFLQRFASFQQGEYYDASKVEEFQEALMASHYFKEVWVEPEVNKITEVTASSYDEIPINAQVTPQLPYQYTMGAGYGTDTGIRGLLGFELRRLTPTGHRFNGQAQASQILNSLQLAYTIPGRRPATDSYVASVVVQDQHLPLGQSTLQRGSVSYVSAYHSWQQTYSLMLQRERSALENQPFVTQLMLIPAGSWNMLIQDDPLRPSRGVQMNVRLLGTPALFSNTPFLQSYFNIKALYPLSKNSRVLTRAAVGYTIIREIDDLPLSFQFFAGGSQSVRGYSYNTIGPGSYLLVGSLEYRYRIKGDWYAAGFLDVGNVSNMFPGKLKKGPGVGVVWQSPVGTLALSVAQASDSPGKPISIQFSMGPDL